MGRALTKSNNNDLIRHLDLMLVSSHVSQMSNQLTLYAIQ